MRKFRNKKFATIIIAFLLVFLVAGGFASFRRTITLNGRVNMFAPLVDIIWADVEVTPSFGPWSTTDRQGIGWPGLHERFVGRTWPTVDTTAIARAQVHAIPPAAPANAVAYWLTAAGAPHDIGSLPDPVAIAEGTLASPEGFRTLTFSLVFDNFDQSYAVEFSLGNPGDVDLQVYEVEVTAELDGAAEAILVNGDDLEALFAPFVGQRVNAGEIVPVTINFSAPRQNWLDFFGTSEGETFLDANFNAHLGATFTVLLHSTIAS